MKKRKLKKNILFILIGLAIIITIIVIYLLNSSSKELEIEFNNNIEVNINEEFSNLKGVKNIKNGEIITNEEIIDTSKVGKYTINLQVRDITDKIKDVSYDINVVDREAPIIEFNNILETDYGKEIDLLKNVKVNDNSNEDINVTIEGEYDFKKSGNYTLYYVASDSSGNITKEEFTLLVKEKKVENNNNSSSNNTSNDNYEFNTSKGFNGVVKNGVTYIDGILIANKTYSLPSSYGDGLTKETKDAFDKMIAAAKLDGFNIRCQSGFRSYSTQNRIYNNYVARDGKEKADTYSARPGHSEHQSGLSCDICSNDSNACINSNFNNTPEAKWASNNAYKYGLILRYPDGKTDETGYKYESWHFRYVGEDLATKLYNNGDWITLENYFGITSKYN